MRYVFWIVLFILISLSSYFYQHRSPETLPVVSKSISTPTPTSVFTPDSAPPIITSSPIPAEPLAVKKENPHIYAAKPKDMIVQFELIDGLAVAYGDTVLGKPGGVFSGTTGHTEIRPPRYWDHGIIPYLIKDDVVNLERIKNTIDYFNQNTTVRFVPYENQSDAIVFVKGESNCASYLGKTGGIQPVFLSEKCSQPEITHELMHALGFVHEQSRIDRDQFLEILWANIEEKFQSQYAMVPEPLMEPYFNSPFDQTSIMMYGSHMFAIKPELETMKLRNGTPFGDTSRKLSTIDIERISRLYPR